VALGPRGEDRSGGQQGGRLVIRESLPAMPRYIEGSVSFLRVERTHSREVVVDGPVTEGTQVRGRESLLSRAVAPGEYRVVSYQRPCDGNCQQLDPPVDRCNATLRVRAGETLTATVVLGQNGGCSVREQSSSIHAQLMSTVRKNQRWARSHLPRMPEARARAAAKARDLDFRVVRRNGRSLFRTDDRVLTRVNVEIRSGSVTRVVGLF
jgi:hypothetical protein